MADVAPTVPAELALAQGAWRRRIARIGSLIQVAFAVLWVVRGVLATGIAAQIPLAVVLALGVVAFGVWGEKVTRGLAPRPTGAIARRIEWEVNSMTVVQLIASFALPVVVSDFGRPDLIIGSISVTIGILLLWFYARLHTAGHLVAGLLLFVVPFLLAAVFVGDPLTAATGLAVTAILLGSAAVGFRSLAYGK